MVWASTLKLFFIAGLFTVFITSFAYPSFKKFMDAGTIIETILRRGEKKDSPSITFCALKNNIGWKQMLNDQDYNWVDMFCDKPSNVETAIACLTEGTFNHSETIPRNKKFHNFFDLNSTLWSEDVLGSQGGIFKNFRLFFWTSYYMY